MSRLLSHVDDEDVFEDEEKFDTLLQQQYERREDSINSSDDGNDENDNKEEKEERGEEEDEGGVEGVKYLSLSGGLGDEEEEGSIGDGFVEEALARIDGRGRNMHSSTSNTGLLITKEAEASEGGGAEYSFSSVADPSPPQNPSKPRISIPPLTLAKIETIKRSMAGITLKPRLGAGVCYVNDFMLSIKMRTYYFYLVYSTKRN